MAESSDEGYVSLQHMRKRNETSGFLQRCARLMEWGELSGELILEVGCGRGISTKTFLNNFPNVKRIIAIDSMPTAIKTAERLNPDGKIEYHVADITERCLLERWMGEISKVFSIFCFNCLEDQRAGYQNVYDLLKPKGAAAILQSFHSGYHDFLQELAESEKWIGWFNNVTHFVSDSRCRKYTAMNYRRLLQEIGFEVVSCYEEKRTFQYTSVEEAKFAISESCPLGLSIPSRLKGEFTEDAFQVYLKYNPSSDDGMPVMSYCTLNVLVQKPDSKMEK